MEMYSLFMHLCKSECINIGNFWDLGGWGHYSPSPLRIKTTQNIEKRIPIPMDRVGNEQRSTVKGHSHGGAKNLAQYSCQIIVKNNCTHKFLFISYIDLWEKNIYNIFLLLWAAWEYIL
jgi:hypothetical protein